MPNYSLFRGGGWLLGALLLLGACKKDKEIQLVPTPTDKVYSWVPVGRLFGTQAIILGMSKDQESVFLHQPNALGVITPNPNSARYRQLGYSTSAIAYLPADVNVRILLSTNFIATREPGDTLVRLIRPTQPIDRGTYGYISPRQLDPQAQVIVPNDRPGMPFGAINRNDFLLFPYATKPDQTLRFVLSKVSLNANGQLRAQSRRILIPLTEPSALVRWMMPVDDYFLANCGDAGLYKIREDGTYKRVFAPTVTDACYKWQGVLYLVEEYNSVIVSKDDGETWQRYEGTPDLFNFTSYRVIGDSLVGISTSISPRLFTLRWQGTRFSARILKSDGLGYSDFTGLEQLGDTVYLGTTNGLFKRPLSKFFETKL